MKFFNKNILRRGEHFKTETTLEIIRYGSYSTKFQIFFHHSHIVSWEWRKIYLITNINEYGQKFENNNR